MCSRNRGEELIDELFVVFLSLDLLRNQCLWLKGDHALLITGRIRHPGPGLLIFIDCITKEKGRSAGSMEWQLASSGFMPQESTSACLCDAVDENQ